MEFYRRTNNENVKGGGLKVNSCKSLVLYLNKKKSEDFDIISLSINPIMNRLKIFKFGLHFMEDLQLVRIRRGLFIPAPAPVKL